MATISLLIKAAVPQVLSALRSSVPELIVLCSNRHICALPQLTPCLTLLCQYILLTVGLGIVPSYLLISSCTPRPPNTANSGHRCASVDLPEVSNTTPLSSLNS
jgi:hypothetical protein